MDHKRNLFGVVFIAALISSVCFALPAFADDSPAYGNLVDADHQSLNSTETSSPEEGAVFLSSAEPDRASQRDFEENTGLQADAELDAKSIAICEYNAAEGKAQSSGNVEALEGAFDEPVVDGTAIGEPVEGVALHQDAETVDLGAQANALANGIYVITTALNLDKCLDVPGASGANGATMNIYGNNATPAQRWNVRATDDGFYEIVSVSSGKALDVAGARKADGTTLQQYDRNQTNAQKWSIVEAGAGLYELVSALSDSFALDVSGGSSADGTRVQLWSRNGTAAQKWSFIATRTIEDGFYVVGNVGSGKALDVAGGSDSDGANIQQYTKNSTPAQTFYFTYDSSSGYYTVTDLGSGKVLDVAGGSAANGANVNQYAFNGTRAQKWAVIQPAQGVFTLRSSISGLALDVNGASKSNGANVQVYANNNTNAQKWNLTKTDNATAEGVYELRSSKNTSNAVDISGGSTTSGANVQMYSANASNAQRFYLRKNGNGVYVLQNPASGLFVNATKSSSGANVCLGDAEQHFKLSFGPGGYTFQLVGAPSSLVLDVAGGSTASGANLQLYSSNGTLAQKFTLKPTTMFANGVYSIRFFSDTNYVVDVPGASDAEGLALHLYESNGTQAQRFMLKNAGNDVYTIMANCSRKYLESASGNGGTEVHQASSSSSDAQMWMFSLAKDGSIAISPRSNGNLNLTAGSGAQNYSAALLRSANGSAAQKWKVVREYSGITYDYLNLTLLRMAQLQDNGVPVQELLRILDPAIVEQSQFLDLRYATDVGAGDLDAFIASTSSGRSGKLAGLGWAFVSAAQQYGLNEVYLLAHAILESGWGTSNLAMGYRYDGGWIDGTWYDAGTYYNFYGIGAVDSSPLSGGRKLAIINGWNTPQAAVIGAAKWISSNYTYAASYAQPTLYAMKWDYARTSASGNRGWHQYATSTTWADSIARLINQCYEFVGKSNSATYLIPQYQ